MSMMTQDQIETAAAEFREGHEEILIVPARNLGKIYRRERIEEWRHSFRGHGVYEDLSDDQIAKMIQRADEQKSWWEIVLSRRETIGRYRSPVDARIVWERLMNVNDGHQLEVFEVTISWCSFPANFGTLRDSIDWYWPLRSARSYRAKHAILVHRIKHAEPGDDVSALRRILKWLEAEQHLVTRLCRKPNGELPA
jgi:hypothetical protein